MTLARRSWIWLVAVIIPSFSIAIFLAFQYSLDPAAADDCNAADFSQSYLHHLPHMMVAVLGGGEEYVLCFVNAAASPTAGVLMYTFLVFAVVILMNMLIAMMAKTFDEVITTERLANAPRAVLPCVLIGQSQCTPVFTAPACTGTGCPMQPY